MKNIVKPIFDDTKKPPLVEFIEAFVKPVLEAVKRDEETEIEML
jgi:hypothetical protein